MANFTCRTEIRRPSSKSTTSITCDSYELLIRRSRTEISWWNTVLFPTTVATQTLPACRARVWSRKFVSWFFLLPSPSPTSRSLLLPPLSPPFVSSRDFPCVFSTHTRARGVPSFNLHDGTWGVCGRATGNPLRRFRNLMQNDLGLLPCSERFSYTLWNLRSSALELEISTSLRELLLSSSD